MVQPRETRNRPDVKKIVDWDVKVSKGAKIRIGYNQVPHPTQDTNGIVTNSQPDTTNESQEVSPFPARDHKAQLNRRAQRHSKHKTEQNTKDPEKKHCPRTASNTPLEGPNRLNDAPTSPLIQMWIKTHRYLVCMKDPQLINASSPKTYKSRYNKEIKHQHK